MQKLVSVIIPIYNVSQYLPECIDSVREQTYQNIQIILVNDGSTDNSLDVCLEYKKKDDRITIINKKNGGLSSARNVGMDAAKGEYFSFIDSDDFVDPRMIDTLVSLLENTNSDISCCNFDYYDENSVYQRTHKADIISSEVYSRQRALELLLSEKYFKCYAWNKLFKSSLFQGVRFPEGQLYEDIVTIYNLIKISNSLSFCGEPMYHYRVRNESITQRVFDKRTYEMLIPIKKIKNDNANNEKILMGCAVYYLYFIDEMLMVDKRDEQVYKEYLDILSQIKEYLKIDTIYGKERKLQMKLCANNFGVYKILYKTARRIFKH